MSEEDRITDTFGTVVAMLTARETQQLTPDFVGSMVADLTRQELEDLILGFTVATGILHDRLCRLLGVTVGDSLRLMGESNYSTSTKGGDQP